MFDANGENLRLSDEIVLIAHNAEDAFTSDFAEMLDIYTNVVQSKMKLRRRLEEMLSSFAELHAKQTETRSIAPALHYINNHLKNGINVPMLAQMCALNESTFRIEFKKQVGTSCVKYINGERIKKARYMIRHEKISISDLSEMLGFYDESRFSKVFKEVTGMTPTQYKKGIDAK